MITALRFTNFKSWRDTGELRLAPVTGLFGANSSGKTSILQMMLMLKQTAEAPDRKRVLHTGDKRSIVDLGTYFEIIHGHAKENPLSIRMSWTLAEPLRVEDPEKENAVLFEMSNITYEATLSLVGRGGEQEERFVVSEFSYSSSGFRFGMRRRSESAKNREEYDLISPNYHATRVQGRPWPLPTPVKCYGFPDEATGYYQNMGFLPSFPLAFETLFSHVAYLGPLREYPQSSYVWAGERPVDVGWRGESAIPALLAAQAEGMKSGRGEGKARRYKTVEVRIAEWLKRMGLIDSLKLEPLGKNRKDYELRVKKTPTSAEVLITDVGFGVSQILPVLVLCYYVPEGSTVILEQPEIHLHPSVQADLADVFIDVIRNRHLQVIVESHSEHLLRRLQRRIAEKALTKDEAAFYFCEMASGASRIEELQVDLFGNITNWPKEFFGNEMGDLVAMTEAGRARSGEGGDDGRH